MELAEESEIDIEALKADRSEQDVDARFSIYELRLMPEENAKICISNLTLKWDPPKRFPLLKIPETEWETNMLRSIVKKRRMQRNTITSAEVAKISTGKRPLPLILLPFN